MAIYKFDTFEAESQSSILITENGTLKGSNPVKYFFSGAMLVLFA